MRKISIESRTAKIVIALLAMLVVTAIYWPGLSGGFLFDDYPNIIDNTGVQPHDAQLSSLIRSALSSPSSELKRPLASLSFAANFLTTGLDPFWMKLTNLLIHLANALLAFVLARRLYEDANEGADVSGNSEIIALVIAFGWAVLPINLTSVLYVVQRMESMANLAVFAGLYTYATLRHRMLAGPIRLGFTKAMAWVLVFSILGLMAKETAALLPLYAFILEIFIYRGQVWHATAALPPETTRSARRIWATYSIIISVPLIAALCWLLPPLLIPGAWASRNFTMSTRLLSEARIVVDYIGWTFLPLPDWLSFYHDDYIVSTGFLSPPYTFVSMLVIAILLWTAFFCRRRVPLISTGIVLYFGCHLLTGTLLPLELVYEHRNYFASFGLLLATIPLMIAPINAIRRRVPDSPSSKNPQILLLTALLIVWCVQTAATAWSWGETLRLAEELAVRAPLSPRAQYELGRTYIIVSQYKPESPLIAPAEQALERAATLRDSSILPEQALIFLRAKMGRPIESRWWDSMIDKLKHRRPGVQDESSLGALTQCAKETRCTLPVDRMVEAYTAALSYDHPRARLLAMYGDYAWSVMNDRPLALRVLRNAVLAEPSESAYRVTLARMLRNTGNRAEARVQLEELRRRDIGGTLSTEISQLSSELSTTTAPPPQESATTD